MTGGGPLPVTGLPWGGLCCASSLRSISIRPRTSRGSDSHASAHSMRYRHAVAVVGTVRRPRFAPTRLPPARDATTGERTTDLFTIGLQT